MKHGVAVAVVVLAVLSVVQVVAAPGAAAVNAWSADDPLRMASPKSATSATGGQKVLVIVEENHTQSQVQAAMPYLVSLQNTFGVTTHHTAAAHPSLPNYLVISGGRTFGVTDDAAPRSHPVSGTSVFGAALAHRMTARTYNQAMTVNCQLTSSGTYAVKHNPWAYFVNERTACRANDVPLARRTSPPFACRTSG